MNTAPFLAILVFLVTGCSSAVLERNHYMAAFQEGDLPTAKSAISQTIDKELPNADYRKSGEATWLLLDRAIIHFSDGDTTAAVKDFQLAVEALDYYNKEIAAESVGKLLLQDELGAYPGEDFEQILAKVYFALALLDQGDMNNAYAMLRNAEEMQQKKREEYAHSVITKKYQLIDNSLGKYLFATLLEKRGDRSNAEILYKQSQELVKSSQVEKDLERIARKPKENKDSSTLLLICHNGHAPRKLSGITDASVASTVALEKFLNTTDLDQFSLSSLGGVPTPILAFDRTPPLHAFVTVDSVKKPFEPWYEVGKTAARQLEQKMPVIVARGVARYLLRRAAVGYAKEKNECMGSIFDVAMLVANLNTKVDTRSWTTLPEEIDLVRYDIEPGIHHLEIRIEPPLGDIRVYHYTVKLEPDQLCVINVFTLNPAVSSIIIPNRFLINKGDPL